MLEYGSNIETDGNHPASHKPEQDVFAVRPDAENKSCPAAVRQGQSWWFDNTRSPSEFVGRLGVDDRSPGLRRTTGNGRVEVPSAARGRSTAPSGGVDRPDVVDLERPSGGIPANLAGRPPRCD